MKLAERILHAVIFEIGAIGVATAAVWFAGAGIAMEAAVGTGLAMSLTAMIWNLVFNYFVDRRFSGKREARGLMFRIGHTLAFEAGLLLFTIPLVAYLLDLSLWHALLADIGLSLLIMVYALGFNWLYDLARVKVLRSAPACP